MKITNKTIVRVPADRNTPELAQKRIEWSITWRYLADTKAKLIYIDESGFNLHLTSGKGWAIVGFTPETNVCTNKGQNISLLAAMTQGKKIDCYHIKRGSITSEVIVEWMERNLFPYCRREFGNSPVVIVMDNAQCHGSAVEACIARNGYRFLKTIPYSPQTNPIERVFSQIKSHVARRVRASGDELIEQIKEGIRSVTEEHVTNYMRAHLAVIELIQRDFLLGSDHVFGFMDETE